MNSGVVRDVFFALAEEQGNAPKAAKTYQRIDDTGKDSRLTAADPRHHIKGKKTNAAPVQCTENGENKRNRVHYHRLYLHQIHLAVLVFKAYPNKRLFIQKIQLSEKSGVEEKPAFIF